MVNFYFIFLIIIQNDKRLRCLLFALLLLEGPNVLVNTGVELTGLVKTADPKLEWIQKGLSRFYSSVARNSLLVCILTSSRGSRTRYLSNALR